MDQKQAYQEKIKANLEELQAQIDFVKSKAHQVSADAQIEYNRKANELEARAGAVRAQLKELMKATEDGWEKIKSQIEESAQQLRRDLEGMTK